MARKHGLDIMAMLIAYGSQINATLAMDCEVEQAMDDFTVLEVMADGFVVENERVKKFVSFFHVYRVSIEQSGEVVVHLYADAWKDLYK